jgi:hypothetical protein
MAWVAEPRERTHAPEYRVQNHEHGLLRVCLCVLVSKSAWRAQVNNPPQRDASSLQAMLQLVDLSPRRPDDTGAGLNGQLD